MALEVEPYGELNLAHCGAVFYVGNFPIVSALAVNASIRAIVRTEGINRVVEDIEEIGAELRTESLTDTELLDHRKIRVESVRSVEGVLADIADRSASGKGKRSRLRLRQRTDVGPDRESIGIQNCSYWREESEIVVDRVNTT